MACEVLIIFILGYQNSMTSNFQITTKNGIFAIHFNH